MIDKLRKKIFWIIQISLSVIILGVILLFTVFSYRNTISSSTIFMDRIEGRMEIINQKNLMKIDQMKLLKEYTNYE